MRSRRFYVRFVLLVCPVKKVQPTYLCDICDRLLHPLVKHRVYHCNQFYMLLTTRSTIPDEKCHWCGKLTDNVVAQLPKRAVRSGP